MKANQGTGNWVQYAGAGALLAFIGYALFQAYNVPDFIFKLPEVQSEIPMEEGVVADVAPNAVPVSDENPGPMENTQTAPVATISPAPEDVPEPPQVTRLEADTESVEADEVLEPAASAEIAQETTDPEISDETEIVSDDPEVSPDEVAVENTPDGALPENPVAPATETEPTQEDTVLEQHEVAALDVPTQEENTDTLPGEPQPENVTSDAPAEPQFDLVRLDASGAGIVAGRADPGTKVRVLSNGIDVGFAEASATGEFVAFVQIPENDEGQSLSLEALGLNENGENTRSTDQVLVLPTESDEEGEELAPTLVRANRENIRVIQPGGLGQIDGVTLDSISYDESGDVILAGRGRAGDALRVYVDNDATAEAVVSSGGTWETRFSSVEEGRYVLRVDALDAAGKVSSRVESPFQRVYPTAEQLAAPSKITVQPGNSLWLMATERYGSGHLYTQIYAANEDSIRDPDLIYPGQIFEMPEVEAPEGAEED